MPYLPLQTPTTYLHPRIMGNTMDYIPRRATNEAVFPLRAPWTGGRSTSTQPATPIVGPSSHAWP